MNTIEIPETPNTENVPFEQNHEQTVNPETPATPAPEAVNAEANLEVSLPLPIPPAKQEEKPCYKLSEEDFLNALEENNGLYAQTARAIEKDYGIPFTRQSVRERAKKYRELKPDYQEKVIEIAKEAIIETMQQDSDRKLKYKAASFLLGSLMKGRYNNPFCE